MTAPSSGARVLDGCHSHCHQAAAKKDCQILHSVVENCLKNSKRQKCEVTDLQRWQGKDELERNQDKMVRRKGIHGEGRQMYQTGNQVKGGGERGSKQDSQERDREGKDEKKRKTAKKDPVEEGKMQNFFLRDKRK